MTIFSENKGIILWNFVTLAYSQRTLFISAVKRDKKNIFTPFTFKTLTAKKHEGYELFAAV